MDFSSLAIAPLAALTTVCVMFVSVLIRRGSEDKALLPAFVGSILLVALLFQPWEYVDWVEGTEDLLILGTLGFGFGALCSLILVKSLRFLRRRFVRER